MKRITSITILILSIVTWFFFASKKPTLTIKESDLYLSRPKYRILITHKSGIGEHEMAERIKLAGKTLNIECANFCSHQSSLYRKIFPLHRERFAKLFQPDIILSLQGDKISYQGAKHYLALTHGSSYYFSQNPNVPEKNLRDFDGYLICFPDKEKLLNFCSQEKKECCHIPWYSTCGKTAFLAPEQFKLFYCGFNMANTAFGAKYKKLFSRLDKTHFFNVYGQKNEWLHTPNCYRGFIKSDGQSLLKTMNRSGVTLILHAPDHYLGQTPTARIFEAAAASTVIISDKNPFIERYFGDSVLYIDSEKTSDEIFDQINNHMKWIQANPKEAIRLAEKSHKIFVSKFSLEDQLLRLIDLHTSISSSEKSKESSYITKNTFR
jgi:hypothetical protein